MENKNFEKKEEQTKNDTDTGIIVNYINKGYNTCLDRTNAKGIYEASKELLDRINQIDEKTLIVLPASILRLTDKLQTELKKSEDK